MQHRGTHDGLLRQLGAPRQFISTVTTSLVEFPSCDAALVLRARKAAARAARLAGLREFLGPTSLAHPRPRVRATYGGCQCLWRACRSLLGGHWWRRSERPEGPAWSRQWAWSGSGKVTLGRTRPLVRARARARGGCARAHARPCAAGGRGARARAARARQGERERGDARVRAWESARARAGRRTFARPAHVRARAGAQRVRAERERAARRARRARECGRSRRARPGLDQERASGGGRVCALACPHFEFRPVPLPWAL